MKAAVCGPACAPKPGLLSSCPGGLALRFPGASRWEPQLPGPLVEQGVCGLGRSWNPQRHGKLGVSQGVTMLNQAWSPQPRLLPGHGGLLLGHRPHGRSVLMFTTGKTHGPGLEAGGKMACCA